MTTWTLAPDEPTEEMALAGARVLRDTINQPNQAARAKLVFKAEVATAPEPGDEVIEIMARAIRAKVPFGYGMTEPEAIGYARAALTAITREDGDPIGEHRLPASQTLRPGGNGFRQAIDCNDRTSCHRHQRCMYLGCSGSGVAVHSEADDG